ncbi:MAG: NAD(P)/FAD-dependent oxidoreductase [Saprospiraceae bacterium]|nr:NAD(P)/FAD-dependent oxidoreductase [Saprospiraceae bacterium]
MAAITAAENAPNARIIILERGKEVLQKVKVSGGGRCNVTHNCTDPLRLATFYPRGQKELLSPFTRFGQKETVAWFEKRGVKLKAEPDGRMFPVTDSSQTIMDCLERAAKKAGIEVITGRRVRQIEQRQTGWTVHLTHHPSLSTKTIFLGTGSNPAIWEMLATLGHDIVEPVPSLFTFNIKDQRLQDLMGVSLEKVGLSILAPADSPKPIQKAVKKLQEEGSLLITHWGLSGFGVLRLSAWGARVFQEMGYQFQLKVNWLPFLEIDDIQEHLKNWRTEHPQKLITGLSPFPVISARLWKSLTGFCVEDGQKNWSDISKKELHQLVEVLHGSIFEVNGKSIFKDEFVTAGGVKLKEIDFKNFESKLFPGLFMAGEVINIDAVTGGFNFQAAWSGGYLAGKAIAERIKA